MAGRDLVNAMILPVIGSANAKGDAKLANDLAVGGIVQLAAVLVVNQGPKRAEHMLLAIAAAVRDQGVH